MNIIKIIVALVALVATLYIAYKNKAKIQAFFLSAVAKIKEKMPSFRFPSRNKQPANKGTFYASSHRSK